MTAYAYGTGTPDVVIEASSIGRLLLHPGHGGHLLDVRRCPGDLGRFVGATTAAQPTTAPTAVVANSSSGIEASLGALVLQLVGLGF